MSLGKLITLEGGEGAGKTTQTAILAERLRRAGVDVFQTREPGGTPRAEKIRDVLLSGKAKDFGPLGEAVLFYAARASHLELAIRPALKRGAFVVCDRFSDSTRAYQGAAGGVPLYVIETIDRVVVGETQPDLTLIFDLPAELGLERAAARNGAHSAPDRFESMTISFHRRLREEFLAIARSNPGRCAIIDASEPPHRVEEQVWRIVRERLSLAIPEG